MKALETRYAGHPFRSGLEARWDALFDLIGWEWTYEPLDANKYLPDFLIHGPYPFLVEVEPDDSLEELKKYVPRIDAVLEGTLERRCGHRGSHPNHATFDSRGSE